jgi:hypothetical protein
MSIKYLRKEVARECPVHMAVLETASRLLSENGYFSKEDVIEETRYAAIEDSIRWDYIVDFLTQEQGVELIPMAPRFFKRHQIQERLVSPEKFIAGGHGKKTAGYCSITQNNGVFAIKILKNRKALTNGVGKAYIAFLDACRAKAQLNPTFQKNLESCVVQQLPQQVA